MCDSRLLPNHDQKMPGGQLGLLLLIVGLPATLNRGTGILMSPLPRAGYFVILLFVGCASAPTSQPSADNPRGKAQLRLVLNEINDACEKKDLNRLDSYHLYGPRFTKFDTLSPAKLDSAAARQGEHNGLSAAKDLHMR